MPRIHTLSRQTTALAKQSKSGDSKNQQLATIMFIKSEIQCFQALFVTYFIESMNFAIAKRHLYFFFINFDKIDLTDYSFLPIGLVSMLTQFSITSSDRNYIPMFSRTELFLVYLRLNNKVVIQLYCVQIPVSV